jgi:hypothetical protein
MANAKRTSLRKSRIIENRNQRTTAPVQPGAGESPDQLADSEKEAPPRSPDRTGLPAPEDE